MQSLAPFGIEAALEAIEFLQGASDERVQQKALALEHARYEVTRTRRQYDAVDPANRLVAAELERRWNQALTTEAQPEAELVTLQQGRERPLTDTQKRELLSFARDLPMLWDDPHSLPEHKKRLLRIALKEIIATSEGDALGKSLPWDAHGPTVVGVVRNASTSAVGNPEPLEFYLTQSRSDALDSVLLLRVSGRPHDFVRRFQDAARALDGRLQPAVLVVSDAYDGEIENTSHALAAIAILGSVAILLSAIGLAGLAGYTVAQRTREIGLRIALGARSGQVVRAILAPMSRPIAIGFVCGALGGSAVARVLRSGIPAMAGLNLFDPFAYLVAMAFFAGVLALSILAPGRRAIRISPSKALQHE